MLEMYLKCWIDGSVEIEGRWIGLVRKKAFGFGFFLR